jgi:hypothetical protein
VRAATTLAFSSSALETHVAAQVAPVRRIERSQLSPDWHGYAASREVQSRPRHHRTTRRHAASKAMPPQRLGQSIRISPASGMILDSCVGSVAGMGVASMTVDCFAAATNDPASAKRGICNKGVQASGQLLLPL